MKFEWFLIKWRFKLSLSLIKDSANVTILLATDINFSTIVWLLNTKGRIKLEKNEGWYKNLNSVVPIDSIISLVSFFVDVATNSNAI